jgi:hypothetical protein
MQVNAQRGSGEIIGGNMVVGGDHPSAESKPAPRLTVRRVHLWLLGDRDYPERLVKLSCERVSDLPGLIERAQLHVPFVA